MAIISVSIRTNGEFRPSRLFSSMFGYIKKSMLNIVRVCLMYKPLRFFFFVGLIPMLVGVILGIRYLIFICMGQSAGHVQSLILLSITIW